MNTHLEGLVSLLYPRRCPVCFQIIKTKGKLICQGCKDKLRYLQEPLCRCCGVPLERSESEYCSVCGKGKRAFEQAVSVFAYPSVSRALTALKYRDKKEYADFFAWEMVRCHGNLLLKWQPDALIPVPLHWVRYLGRGYNQAELLAEKIGAPLQIPVRKDILYRRQYTSPQKKLGRDFRWKNLRKAIKAKTTHLKTVVLVDDIYTTGSTVEACALALQAVGVEHVYVITAANGQGV